MSQIATGNALTNKTWGEDLFQDSLQETFFFKFMGKSPNAMFRLLTETQKKKGDTITVPYVGLLTGEGKTENEALYNNEEIPVYTNDVLTINELWNAVEVPGPGSIDLQRVSFEMRDTAKELLRMWFQERYDVALFRHLCGYAVTPAASGKVTLFNTPLAPSANNKVFVGTATTDQALATTDLFSFTVIDQALLKAKLNTPKIKPIMVGGKKMYVAFLHPTQVRDLQTSTTVGNWFDIQSKRLQGGDLTGNPIFTGALGEYKGVVLHESEYVTDGVDSTSGATISTVKRAVLCGAGAAAVAFGDQYGDKQFAWREELKDYGRTVGIGGGIICGVKKLRFTAAGVVSDNAVITMSSYGTP